MNQIRRLFLITITIEPEAVTRFLRVNKAFTEIDEKIKITVEGVKCERCGHEWTPRDINDNQEYTLNVKVLIGIFHEKDSC